MNVLLYCESDFNSRYNIVRVGFWFFVTTVRAAWRGNYGVNLVQP